MNPPCNRSASTSSSSELGKGATGKVYLGEDPFANRKVAIKVAFPEALKSSEDGAFYQSMFLNEAALAGKLQPPAHRADLRRGGRGQVQLHRDGVRRGRHAREVLQARVRCCEPREVAEIIFKCVRALAFAQTLGLTHRDIKPGNILHNEGTEIKIADFGAAINKVSDRTMITNVGSPAYMAPELVTGDAQARTSPTSTRSAWSCTTCSPGSLPFRAPTR